MLRLKRHDTAPDLVAHLTDNGTPVDVSTAAGIKVIGAHDTDLNVHFSRTVTGTSEGVVTMPFQAADTAVAGLLNVEIEVTWPGGAIQTFPGNGYLQVLIEDDLG